MIREQTFAIPYVRLREGDLRAVADRCQGLVETRKRDAAADYDRSTQEQAEGYLTEHGREDHLKSRAAFRDAFIEQSAGKPEYTVASRVASFRDSEWETLWSRVSSDDVRYIEMEAYGRSTHLKVSLDLGRRDAGGRVNAVYLRSSNEAEFDQESGFFAKLWADRSARQAAAITEGLAVWVWLILGALVLSGFASGLLLALPITNKPVSVGARVAIVAAFMLIALPLSSGLVGWLFDRIAPRVVIHGVGPYERYQDWVVGALVSLAVAAAVALATAIAPGLAG